MTENKESKSKKKKKKKKSSPLKVFFKIVLILILFFGVAVGGMTLAMIKTAPELDINQVVAANQPSIIYDDKGQAMDTLITDKKRIIIKRNEMPKNLLNAFVSIEDERFYEHGGVDLKRTVGMVFIDIKQILTRKGEFQGGSTITQQLLKNTIFDTDTTNLDSSSIFKRKVTRKVQEWYLAPKLEKAIGKDAVLEAYLNTIYLGGRSIGVEAASQQYFGCSTKDLDLVQCAFLAGLTQSPSVYYPYSKTSKKDASKYKNRTKTVLSKMKDNGYISEAEYNKAIAEVDLDKEKVTNDKTVATIGKSVVNKPTSSSDKYNFEWFSRPVVNEVKKDLKSKYKYTDEEIDNLLTHGNLKIYSTMDKELQLSTQNILNDENNLRVSSNKNKDGITEPQMSAVLVDYHTGQVKVMVGGRGEQPAMSYNRAYDARVAPGSSIKPLTIYSPAIDTKIATAATVLEDSPLSSSLGKKYNGGNSWNPKNSPNKYSGYLNMRDAIKNSVNIYAIKMEDKIGLPVGATYGEKFGLTLNNTDKNSMAALALGELNSGTNTYTMANAYGVFGNNGMYTQPKLYSKVVDKTGKTILEPKVETKAVVSPQTAYIMYDMLKGPIQDGTATRLKSSYNSDIPIAGKTGSTSNFKNLWFCGLTPYYSGSVWIGNKNDQKIYSSDAAYIFGKIMNEAVKNKPNKDIPVPSGINTISVDKVSGLLPTQLSYLDPRGSMVYSELFIDGTEPTERDNIHVSVEINKMTGKLAGKFTPDFLKETRVFIIRNYSPSVFLEDSPYVLPTEVDDYSSPTTPEPTTPEDGNENNNTGDNNNNTNNNNTENNGENTGEGNNNNNEGNTNGNTGDNGNDQNTGNTNGNNSGTPEENATPDNAQTT